MYISPFVLLNTFNDIACLKLVLQCSISSNCVHSCNDG